MRAAQIDSKRLLTRFERLSKLTRIRRVLEAEEKPGAVGRHSKEKSAGFLTLRVSLLVQGWNNLAASGGPLLAQSSV